MKRFASLLLAVLVAFSLCVPAMAAERSGFRKVNTYTEGQFSDVPADAWCAANVQTAYEYGIMGGKTTTYFDVNGSLTVAQTIVMAARLHSGYNGRNAEFAAGDPWYQSYLDYAKKNGIVWKYDQYDVPITRAEFARVLSSTLPDSALKKISDIEEGAIPEGDDAFGQQTIGAHKVGTIIKVSEELLNDAAFDLEGYFSAEFARRIGNKEEDAFFNGDGASKPLGILADDGGADIGVTAASATAITAEEIISLFYSLEAPYRENAIWVFNDSTMAAIRKLKGSDGQFLWQKALHEGDHETLLGKPVFTSPFMPEIAAGSKPVLFGDFSFYWIGDRQGVTFKRLNERYADTGQIGFLATKRVDAKLVLPEAMKVLQMKSAS